MDIAQLVTLDNIALAGACVIIGALWKRDAQRHAENVAIMREALTAIAEVSAGNANVIRALDSLRLELFRAAKVRETSDADRA